jgi:hypothetical protein
MLPAAKTVLPPAGKNEGLKAAAEHLVQPYEALGRPEQAVEWKKKLTDLAQAAVASISATNAPPK